MPKPETSKHAGGRPTKYNQDMQDKADDYLINYKVTYDDEVPSKVGLACELHVNTETLTEWGKVHDVFSVTLAEIQAKQHRVLVNKGLTTEFNSNICKLMLANHGHSDKQDIEHSGSINFTNLSDEELEAIAKDG